MKPDFWSYRSLSLMAFILIVIPLTIFSQPDMPIDSSLKNNSQHWKVKLNQKLTLKYKPASVSFGPVKTIETSSEKAILVSKEKNKGILWKTRTTHKSKECNITMICDENDTAWITIRTIITEESEDQTAFGKIVDKDRSLEGSSVSFSWADEMIILLQNDTAAWYFERTDSVGLKRQLLSFTGILWSGADTFKVKSADNFSGQKMKKVLFTQPAAGFTIYQKNEQVAALQYMAKNAVWLRSDIVERKRRALIAVITCLFACNNNYVSQ